MDPAVTAALIAAPVTIVAAAAAFAAGQTQARGAHRGPVDAVRRQHQRDGYAALLAALNDYKKTVNWDGFMHQARMELYAAGTHDAARQTERALELLRAVSLDQVIAAMHVVMLEGPDKVVIAATRAAMAALRLREPVLGATPIEQVDADVRAFSRHLGNVIADLTNVARQHLNGDRID